MLQKPDGCNGCALQYTGTGFSIPDGTGSLRVLIMGEALGSEEAREGLPYRPYAQAGSLLQRVLKMCGFDRQQFRMYNTVNCQPPKNWLDGAPWEQAAISHCEVHRNRVVNDMRPRAILATGNVPLRALTGLAGKNRGISYLRGYVLPSQDWGGIPVIPTWHPSFIKRGKQQYVNMLAHDLKKAVAVAQGKFTNYVLNQDDYPSAVNYITKPSADDFRSYLLRAKENQGAWLGLDIETGESMFKDEDADDEIAIEITAGEITQIQFSLGPGEAICVPWCEPFIGMVRELLSWDHVKAAHNGWRFDLPVLKRSHVRVNGVVHDTRWMWHHQQPDLPAHLQCVGSFYGMPFPWKHMASYNEEFYGCADVDVLSRIVAKLPQQMQAKGTWASYERQIVGLEPILVNMSRRGIPVDDGIRKQLGDELDAEKLRMQKEELQPLMPAELQRYHPADGYKKPPRDKTGLIQVDFSDVLNAKNQDSLFDAPVIRWAEPLYFNPKSPEHVKAYLKFKGYPVPKHHKSGKDTTEETELLKLAKKYKDKALHKMLSVRELGTMKSTFVDGWVPAADMRVHSSFGFGTAVGQLAAKNPNVLNFPKRSEVWAKKMRKMIRAAPGRKIVEADFSSFHAVTLAFEAQSVNWLRLARSDIHSFTAAHFLKLPERDALLSWPDEQLKEYLAWVKETHRATRDNKAKHAILGVGNGLGYRELYRRYSDYFAGEKESKLLLDTIKGIFPEVFVYQNRRREEAHRQTYLVTRFGYIRWFFDVLHWDPAREMNVPGDDSEAALSFHHVNDAFGHMREQMLWLRATGNDEKWRLINSIHDSFIFEPDDKYVEECAHYVHEQMSKRSPLLIDPVTSPDGLWVDAEISVGQDWAGLEKISKGWRPRGLDSDGLAELAPASYTDIWEATISAPQLKEAMA